MQIHKNKDKRPKQTTETNYNQQTCVSIVLIQGSESSMRFAAVSAKTLKTVKCLPKILFNIDIMDLRFLVSAFSLNDDWKV